MTGAEAPGDPDVKRPWKPGIRLGDFRGGPRARISSRPCKPVAVAELFVGAWGSGQPGSELPGQDSS
jgi:hypothetical protein